MADVSSLHCARCDQRGHIAEHCPHYVAERIEHQDGWAHFDNAPPREADDGNNCILRDAVELPQPGDGHCLFHSLAGGLSFFNVDTTGPALRVELANWLRSHPTVSVAGNTFEQWISHATGKSVSDYCLLMERTKEWGGGVELKAFTHCKEMN